MSCFCHATTAQLVARLQATASFGLPGLPPAPMLPGVFLPGSPLGTTAAQLARALATELADWLLAHALPAEPWQPDRLWLTLQLPRVQLTAQTVATISALAQMRAQVLAQFGLDLLIPAQVMPFIRILATLNARLDVMAQVNISAAACAHWQALALLDRIIETVLAALADELLPLPTVRLPQFTMPGGIPMPQWSGFLANLQLIAPLIAAAIQLNVSLTETAQFSAALRVLARLQLPALAQPQFVAMISATLSATAQLALSLKVDPLALGLAAVERLLAEKLADLMRAIAAATGIKTLGAGAALAWPRLQALLPVLPVVPSGFATTALVTAALQAQAIAGLNWQVKAALPSVSVALQAAALIGQFTAVLGTSPLRLTPCASGCDAARLTRALTAAATG